MWTPGRRRLPYGGDGAALRVSAVPRLYNTLKRGDDKA